MDQIIKHLIQTTIPYGHSIPLLGNFLKLTHIRNTGAAFSLFTGYSSYLVIIGAIIVCVLIYFHYHASRKDLFVQSALAFILGGSLGNLSDRIFHSYVVDYVHFYFCPIFNLADVMINVGIVMLILHLIQKGEKDAANLI